MAERPEDLNLPNAVITRIIKEAVKCGINILMKLPDGVNISKEARTAISKAASVFVLYATSSANNFAMKAKRKTLTGQDVLSAMQEMDFEKFVEPLTECLEAFKKEQRDKKASSEKRRKDKENATKQNETTEGDNNVDEVMENDDSTNEDSNNDEES